MLANAQINRLAAHSTLHQLAWSISGVFLAVFLLRAGVPPAGVFLSIAAVAALRFALRTLVVRFIAEIGLRRGLILGTLLFACQFPALSLVRGIGRELVVFCVIAAVADVFYWTCYHTLFAMLGDTERRGTQLGARQALGALAAVSGPIIGGVTLAHLGAWAAFGAAAVIEALAALPIVGSTEPAISRTRPANAYKAAWAGISLIATDGWLVGGATLAWDIIAFRALHERFDVFGGALSAAALAGALTAMILGRFIDLGHARHAVWINATACAGIYLFKAFCGSDPALVVAATVAATALSGVYNSALLTAFYNTVKAAPCPFRFDVAAEGGWDIGAMSACVIAAIMSLADIPLQAVVLLAIPAVAIQARLLRGQYRGARTVREPSAAVPP